ncbi:MAG TPA: Rrf2 family transcriptional regulator [Chloroflexota bacterium]|nr:Rrf2 family transcriptional regulator [Chloroflexota bacterium]
MKLSKRSEYGLKALIDLAAFYGQGPVQAPTIARKHGISLKFLELILLDLRRAGVLHSRQGIHGGYYLAKPPSEITIGEVVRILDGTIAPIRCVSRMSYERCTCPDENLCELRLIMLEVRNAIANVLDNISLADINQNALDRTVRAADVLD